MKYKSIFLYIYFSLFMLSCTLVHNTSTIKDPPIKQFVKVYKNLEVTRCLKNANSSSEKTCETRNMSSSGSGVFVDLVKDIPIVLTAGHVCDNLVKLPKDDGKYSFSIDATVVVQNHKGKFYRTKTILSEHNSSQANINAADLCTLLVFKSKDGSTGLKIDSQEPKLGEFIYYMGAPMGIYHPPSMPIVGGYYSGKIDDLSSLTSAPASPGSSGSAVLSSRNKIYGVLFAVHPGFNTASVITNHDKTKDFLKRTKILVENAKRRLQSDGT